MSTARVWFQLDVFFGGGFIYLQWMVESLNLVWSCVDPFWCHPPTFILVPLCKLVTLRSKPGSDAFKKICSNRDQKQSMTNMTRLGPRTEVTLLKEMLLIIWLSGNTRKKLQGRGLKDKSTDFTRNNYEGVCFGKICSWKSKHSYEDIGKRGQRIWVLGFVIQLSEKTFTWSDSYLTTNHPTTDCTNTNHTNIWTPSVFPFETFIS